MKYRVTPWRGISTGNVYYNVERADFLFWSKIITCFSEQEANDMIAKLGCWDNGRPTSTHTPAMPRGEAQ